MLRDKIKINQTLCLKGVWAVTSTWNTYKKLIKLILMKHMKTKKSD